MGGIDPVSARRQQLQAVENAKAQLASIKARTDMTTECIQVLEKAGKDPMSDPEISPRPPSPLLVAMCKVQLAQLRMSEQEGLAAIAGLMEFIKKSESPLTMAGLVPPNMRGH